MVEKDSASAAELKGHGDIEESKGPTVSERELQEAKLHPVKVNVAQFKSLQKRGSPPPSPSPSPSPPPAKKNKKKEETGPRKKFKAEHHLAFSD